MAGVRDEGRKVGRYTVQRQLAEGGMGRVLLARTEGPAGFTKQVVLKTLHPHLAADQAFLEVFLVEARVSAALFHPNVAQVFELVEDGGEYFLVMEYVRGKSLRELLRRRGALPRAVALSIVSHLLRALQHAHEAKDERGAPLHLLHRDVSPENVLLSFDGAVKLVDFGLAGVRGRRAGKEGYVAPEIVEGAKPSVASDLFGAGVVLAECLTAALPPEGVDAQPEPLRALLVRALAPAPERRFPSAASFADAVDEAARAAGDFVTPAALAALLEETFGAPEVEPSAPPRHTAVLTGVGGPAPATQQAAVRSKGRRSLVLAGAALLLVGAVAMSLRDEAAPQQAEAAVPGAAPPPIAAPVVPPAEVSPEVVIAPVAVGPAEVKAPAVPEPPRPAQPVAPRPPSPAVAPKSPGLLDLRVIPWAHVEVDGAAAGTTPLRPLSLTAGRHVVRVSNPDLGVTATREVEVQPGASVRLSVDLLDELDSR